MSTAGYWNRQVSLDSHSTPCPLKHMHIICVMQYSSGRDTASMAALCCTSATEPAGSESREQVLPHSGLYFSHYGEAE